MKIYQDRIRVVEAIYRVGAKKPQIWWTFTKEILMVLLLPVLVSTFAFIPLIRLAAVQVLGVPDFSVPFTLWIPGWLLLVVIISSIIATMSGWFAGIIPQVRSYRPIKQE